MGLSDGATFCETCGSRLHAHAGVATVTLRSSSSSSRSISWVEPGGELGGCRIVRQIGRGGMGVVYLAEQLGTGRLVAVKVVAPRFAADRVFRERFQSEARHAASIKHANVITVHDAGEAHGVPYLIMDYIDGRDLRKIIETESPLDPRRVAAIVAQVGAALDAAHAAGLVHRDVKPGNVLVARSNSREHVYLTDFGLTKRFTAREAGFTNPGEWVGTVDYTAPEQLEGRRVGSSTDVYALGCVLYQALTGVVPYPRDTDAAKVAAHLRELPPPLRAVRPELPPTFDAVISRAMAKDPAHRFPSAGDLGRAAISAAAGSPISASQGSVATGAAAAMQTQLRSAPAHSLPAPPPQPKPGPRRPRWVWWALGGIALFAAAFGVVLLVSALSSHEGSKADANRQAANRTLALTNSTTGLTNQLTQLSSELGKPTTAARRRQIQAALSANRQQLTALRNQASREPTSASPQVNQANSELLQVLNELLSTQGDLVFVVANPNSPQVQSKLKDAITQTGHAQTHSRQIAKTLCPQCGPGSKAQSSPRPAQDHHPPAVTASVPAQLQWSLDSCGASCPPRPAAMTYDGATARTLLVGRGSAGPNATPPLQTWTWDGSHWQQLSPANSPTFDNVTGMTYDPAHGEIVLLGYSGGASQTWTWDGANWNQQQPATSPPPLFSSSMAYDPAHQEVVMFGGSVGDVPSSRDTWLWDGSNWTKAKPPGALPGARQLAAMAYDPGLDGVLLFGGVGLHLGSSKQPVNYHDTWLWDGTRWQQENQAANGGPPTTTAASGYSMIVNPLTHGVSLLGADASGKWQQWQWNGSGWSSLTSASSPTITAPANGTLAETVAAFDAQHHRIVELNSGTQQQTWLGAGSSTESGTKSGSHLVNASGSVGSLVLGKASEADVIKAVGLPDAEADASPITQGYPPAHAIGYNCTSSGQAPSGYIAAGNPSAALKCMTVYWVNSNTGKVTSFGTVDPAYQTEKGTHAGMGQAQASRLEGQQAISGCGSGIFESGSTATLRLLNEGGTHGGSTPSNVLNGGTVSEIDLELKHGGVGIQFC